MRVLIGSLLSCGCVLGSVHQRFAGTFRLLVEGLTSQISGLLTIELTGGNALKDGCHNDKGLAVTGKLGPKGAVDGFVNRLNFLLAGPGVSGGIVNGLQAGSGNGSKW